MMKVLLFLGLVLAPLAGAAQTTTSYYSVQSIPVLKALTARPAVVQVLSGSPGIFSWSSTNCNAPDDFYQVAPTDGPSGCYSREGPPLGIPISPAKPDTIQGYFALTTQAGSSSISFAGVRNNPAPNFTTADIGKLIICTGIGPTEGRLITTISGVAGAAQITTATNATQSMTGVSQRCVFGSDQTANLQAAFDAGRNNQIGSFVQGGVYLVTSPLTCLPPATANNGNISGSLCKLDPGAVIMAAAPMTSVLTYGSTAKDYTGFLRQSVIQGGTIDANFVADYAVSIPFSILTTRRDQVTKNAKKAGVKWGDNRSPQASAGSQDLNSVHIRDANFVPIVSITGGRTLVVTTQFDHGYTTGRVVAIDGVSGMTKINRQFFTITVTSATTFILNNTDGAAYETYSGGGTASLTMPSMRVPAFISSITNTNPGIVTTAKRHGFTNGMQVWLADVSGMALGGIYTVESVTDTTFQLQGINTTALGAYTGQGSVIEYLAPTNVEKAIYYINATDADIVGGTFQGTRIGIYSDPTTAGYDSKVIKPHFYNYNYDGDIFSAISQVGDNTYTGVQCDGPIRYCIQLSGPNNTVIGSRLNGGTGEVLAGFNNYTSFIRLDNGASVLSVGNGMKGEPGLNILGEVSVNGGGWSHGAAPGYSSYNVQTRFTTFTQPSSLIQAAFQIKPTSSTATATISGDQGDTRLYVYDRRDSHGGLMIATTSRPASVDINTIDASGAYVGTPIKLSGGHAQMPGNVTIGGSVAVNGGYYANGSIGLSATKTVRDPAGTGTCTLIFTFGLLTGGTCQ